MIRAWHGRRLSRLTAIAALAMLALLVWFAGLMHFATNLPRVAPASVAPADGIVVLTGGAARIEVGLSLLGAGKAQRMFISGVHPGIGKAAMRPSVPGGKALLDCCVDLGFSAVDTYGNAVETAAWAQKLGYRRLLVVTANYHMPRALVELRHRMPGVELVAYPVIPRQFKLEQWWSWPGSASLLVVEFNKYLLASLRAWLDQITGGEFQSWLYRGEPAS